MAFFSLWVNTKKGHGFFYILGGAAVFFSFLFSFFFTSWFIRIGRPGICCRYVHVPFVDVLASFDLGFSRARII